MAQRLTFDLTDDQATEGGGFELIEEGTYDVEISEAEDTQSAKKGTKQYKIQYKATDGGFKGVLFEDVYITPGTLLKGLKAFIKATGRGPVPTREDQSIPLAEDLIGAEMTITVVHETYEGVTRSKVKGFSHKPLGSGGAKKSSDGKFDL